MAVILDLPPDLEARLREKAAQRGQAVGDYLLMLAEANSAPASPPAVSTDPTLALFAQWAAEDVTDDPDELAARQREGDELMAALRENRFNLEGRTDFARFLHEDEDEAA